MADLRKDIISILTQCKSEIQANMASKGENASGRTSRGFKVVETAESIRLVLTDEDGRVAPLETLEIGRPAGNVPGGFRGIAKTGRFAGKPDVSSTFKAILVEWAAQKGIADFGWAEATSLGRRIAYEGTIRNKENQDIYSTPVNKATERLRTDIRAAIQAQIHNTITRF